MTDNTTILLIEDDADLNEANRRALELKKYKVLTALAGRKRRQAIQCGADI